MIFSKISGFLFGFVTIVAESIFPERFINLCTKNGIRLKNIKRRDKTHIVADTGIREFKKIHKNVPKPNCKIHIEKKHGLPFFMHRYRKRKMLAGGAILFFVFLYAMTRFVWIIQITGNETVSDKEIAEAAKRAGLRAGMYVNSVNSEEIQSYLMTNMEKLKFVSVNRAGTVVYIDVRERENIREHFDITTPTNIIAAESGVIEKMLVQSGTAAVSKGDIVYKGQLLVSGAGDNKALGIKYSRSDAEIMARVWHEKTLELPFYKTEKQETGRVKNKRKLKIFGFSLNLFIKNKILFEKYDILSYTSYISLGEGKIIPIGIETTQYREYTQKRTELTPEQTKELLASQMDAEYKNSEIVSKNFTCENGKVTAVYECIEDIATEEEPNDDGQTP